MSFLSLEFIIFFTLFLPIYWSVGRFVYFQNLLLLIASLFLLGKINLLFLLIVILFTIIIFLVANRIFSSEQICVKNSWLYLGISLVLLNLAFFKYFDFFRLDIQRIFENDMPDLFLPLGISYYTFQSISYLLSIYHRKELKLSFLNLLLYFSFFPTITAGPIIRLESQKSILGMQTGMFHQINSEKPRYIIRPALAIGLILLAIIKKWWLVGILSDNWVNPVFENPLQYDVMAVLVAIYGYTFQLFLDFSGYTDLVVGLAMFFGFQLPKNFHMPLIAHNIRVFWERWHMTLSAWIRDYIYIPLGGNRLGFKRTQINIMLAMVLSGLWHGYGWNFLLWGLLHGLAFILLNYGDKKFGRDAFLLRYKYGRVVGIFLTFSFVSGSFVIFRTDSLEDARLIFVSLLGGGKGLLMPNLETLSLLFLLFFSICFYKKMVSIFGAAINTLERLPVWLWPIPIIMIFLFLLIVAPSGIPGFIYANF